MIGAAEWLWIALFILLLLFGSKKLPELARAIGRAMGEFEKGRRDIEKELHAASQQAIATTSERERLERAAKELGIQVEGKTDQQLREEIVKAVGS